MTNKQLQELLKTHPDDMPMKLSHNLSRTITDFTEENILHTSTTAYYIPAQEDDEQDEFGLGDGEQYLLINPIIY